VGHKETFGCDPVPHHGKHINMWSAAWDITGSKGEVTDSSFWHPSYSMYDDGEVVFGEMFDHVPLAYGVNVDEGDSDWEASLQGAENQSDPDQGMGGQDHVIPHEIYHDSEEADTLAIIYASLTNIYDNQSVPTGDFSSTVQHNASVGQQSLVGGPSMAPDDAFSEHLLQSYPSTLLERPPDLQDDLPDFPVLFSTEKHIRLLQSPSLRASTICRKALEQNVPPHLHLLNQYSRLNMVAQIPDLSLAIVGSQSGRVALLTLTASQSIPDKYAFRLEAILPFKSQEKEGFRPDVPLAGLAVAPIQGRELAVDRSTMTDISAGLGCRSRTEAWRRVERTRRYRLMIMYYCGSVLSYELGRDGERVNVEGTGGQLLAL
jgi:CRT10